MDKKELRIIYVSHRYHTNQVPVMNGWKAYGAQVTFWASYEGAVESHQDVDFYLMKPSLVTKLYNKYVDKRYKKVDAEGMKSSRFIPQIMDIVRHLKYIKPDILILRNYSIGNLFIILACRICGFKNIIMYTQTPLYGKVSSPNFIKEGIARLFFPRVCFTPVLYIGEDRKVRKKNTFYTAPQYFVPLIYGAVHDKDNKGNYKIRILDVGKYREYKNHFFLVDVISELPSLKYVEVTIIGQLSNENERDYYSKLEQYIKEKGLESTITLCGNVPYKEMTSIYSNYDILILPSKHESAGMVVLEGLAHGMCVMCSNGNGTGCYLDEYECGLVFSANTTNDLVRKLSRLLENPGLIKEYGDKGKAAIENHLSFKNYLEGINRITENEFDFSVL